jgi:hypothetical protein
MNEMDARRELERGCDLYERGQKKRAFSAFLAAAKLGNVEAQVNLANLYDSGEGVRRNIRAAKYWYRRAVRNGSAEGAYNLSITYENLGQSRWQHYWLRVASQLGDKDARKKLKDLRRSTVVPVRRAARP